MGTYLCSEFIVKEAWKALCGWFVLQNSVAILGHNPPKPQEGHNTGQRYETFQYKLDGPDHKQHGYLLVLGIYCK
jgi:hypothetical protein